MTPVAAHTSIIYINNPAAATVGPVISPTSHDSEPILTALVRLRASIKDGINLIVTGEVKYTPFYTPHIL